MRNAWLGALALAALMASGAVADTLLVKNLKVLIPVYRGAEGDADRLSDDDVAGILAGCERTRLFYFRNTSARLNLQLDPMLIDARAPESEGPTYEYIEADLLVRGVEPGDYDGVFTTGVGLKGNWGGFDVLGHAGGCFGMPDRRGGLTWYPEDDPDVWYGVCWTFTHEFQHALDLVIAGRFLPEMLHGHPYADNAEPYFVWKTHDGAQHFSWEAWTLREFGEKILVVPGVRREWVSCEDADADGLPDEDPRLPADEARLGSSPASPDSDADGLGDLAEFTADIFLGSDPMNPDSDGDGVPDGSDANPSVALAAEVAYAATAPAVDGVAEPSYAPLFSRAIVGSGTAFADASVEACWDEDFLYLLVRAESPVTLEMELDGSGDNGYWAGGDTYVLSADAQGVRFAGLGLSGAVPGAASAVGADGLEIAIPALLGQGVSHEINWGGARRREDTTDGLHLEHDRPIGLNVALASESGRALFTPNFQTFVTRLHKAPDDPIRPSLRGTAPLSKEMTPTALVSGVRATDLVEIVDAAGAVVGRRIGNGPALLTGALARGENGAAGVNEVRARVGEIVSAPARIEVDLAAGGATAGLADGELRIQGEPNASVEVFAGAGGFPLVGLGSLDLDGSGAGTFALPDSFDGFLGAYAEGVDFPDPLFHRVDPSIHFNYQGDTCDARLPGDGFCVVWTGDLAVAEEGEYTFYLTTDDGSRLLLDGALVIDNWGHHADQEKTATVRLSPGSHRIEVRYYEEYGWAAAYLEWSGPGVERTPDLPVSALPFGAGEAEWFVRQTDAAGNVSFVSPATR